MLSLARASTRARLTRLSGSRLRLVGGGFSHAARFASTIPPQPNAAPPNGPNAPYMFMYIPTGLQVEEEWKILALARQRKVEQERLLAEQRGEEENKEKKEKEKEGGEKDQQKDREKK